MEIRITEKAIPCKICQRGNEPKYKSTMPENNKKKRGKENSDSRSTKSIPDDKNIQEEK